MGIFIFTFIIDNDKHLFCGNHMLATYPSLYDLPCIQYSMMGFSCRTWIFSVLEKLPLSSNWIFTDTRIKISAIFAISVFFGRTSIYF